MFVDRYFIDTMLFLRRHCYQLRCVMMTILIKFYWKKKNNNNNKLGVPLNRTLCHVIQ
jgi:hypothetical protein